jgi:hypothetical protein
VANSLTVRYSYHFSILHSSSFPFDQIFWVIPEIKKHNTKKRILFSSDLTLFLLFHIYTHRLQAHPTWPNELAVGPAPGIDVANRASSLSLRTSLNLPSTVDRIFMVTPVTFFLCDLPLRTIGKVNGRRGKPERLSRHLSHSMLPSRS